MSRAYRMDAAEALTNAIAGLVVSWLAVVTLFPLFGWTVSAGGAAGVSALFFGISTARNYVVRRVFRRLGSPARNQ